MEGIIHIAEFVLNPTAIFDELENSISWDDRMTARKTASYGVAYNYSQMSYPFNPLLPVLEQFCLNINKQIGFEPNNCLINYYLDGKSKMGFHTDQVDILEHNTGVAIISLGQSRVLRFRKIENKEHTVDFTLSSGSLLYMNQAIQSEWEHAIPKADTDLARMSLTFRKIKGY
jgi:alkylated DNA repair dioxygenase AlkB